MSSSKSLDQNLDEFLRMHIELANSGENEALSDENQAIIILNSLPESYREVKTAIKYGRTSITLEEVISALKSKDLEMRTEKGGHSNGEVNLSRGKPGPRKPWNNRGRSQGRNSNKPGGYQRGRSNSNTRNTDETNGCYNCGKPGHFKRDCYFLKRNNKQKPHGQGDSKYSNSKPKSDMHDANVTAGYESGEVYQVGPSIKDEWILDSGCTFHMTNNKAFMFDFRKTNGGRVILGNNQTCDIQGSGSISFKMHDGMVRTLSEIRYVPNLARNLISLSVLDDQGIVSKIESGQMKISKGALTIMKGHKDGGLYYLKGQPVVPCNYTAHSNTDNSNAMLWHKRLGHISEKGLQLMSEQNLLGKDKNMAYRDTGLLE
ncbi:hypothetical protein CsatB_002594 [Cannabis sativa]